MSPYVGLNLGEGEDTALQRLWTQHDRLEHHLAND